MLYGPQSVGKTTFIKDIVSNFFEKDLHVNVTYVDCNSISAQISSADSIDVALEYFLEHYKQA